MRVFLLGLCVLTACGPSEIDYPDFSIDDQAIVSGFSFLTEESQKLQNDPFENPGYLWIETGEQLFTQTMNGTSCKDCHDNPAQSFSKAALTYPKINSRTDQLVNLEGQINICRSDHQNRNPWTYESEELLSITSYLRNFSNGTPIDYTISQELRPYFENGKAYFYTRRGQFNLSCHQCHDLYWGTKMRGDTVSQGHINGFPAYRNDWQSLGSAHRRFEACDIGVRAEPNELGSNIYMELEVYLMARGNGLISETPAIRR